MTTNCSLKTKQNVFTDCSKRSILFTTLKYIFETFIKLDVFWFEPLNATTQTDSFRLSPTSARENLPRLRSTVLGPNRDHQTHRSRIANINELFGPDGFVKRIPFVMETLYIVDVNESETWKQSEVEEKPRRADQTRTCRHM